MLSEQNIECGSETVKIHKKCILQADFGKFVLFEAFGQPPSWRKGNSHSLLCHTRKVKTV